MNCSGHLCKGKWVRKSSVVFRFLACRQVCPWSQAAAWGVPETATEECSGVQEKCVEKGERSTAETTELIAVPCLDTGMFHSL